MYLSEEDSQRLRDEPDYARERYSVTASTLAPDLVRITREDSHSGYHSGRSGSSYRINQPRTTSTTITTMIVPSNPYPALFFPNLNVILHHAPDR